MNIFRNTVSACMTVVALLSTPLAAAAEPLVVYSARNEQLIKPLFDAYTKETGQEIRYITDKAGPLMARLLAEGASTPADLLITVDAGNLWQAAERGLLQAVESNALTQNIPAHLRDPSNRWFGLSVRARTLVYNPNRVQDGELVSYEGLADAKWKGRLCLRTSKKVYNQSLVAMLLAEHGEAETERMVRGWVANLAVEPLSDDTKALQAVASGVCDVTVVNTYYLGRLLRDDPNLPLATFWPNQDAAKPDTGVHVNVSGAGVTVHSRRRAQAVQLLEWLSSPTAQAVYADVNLEYPASPQVQRHPLVASWGDYRANALNVSEAGRLQAQAVMLMDRAGYR